MNKYADKSKRPYILMAVYFAGWVALLGLSFLAKDIILESSLVRYKIIAYSFAVMLAALVSCRFYSWYFRYYRWRFSLFDKNVDNVEPKASYFAFIRIIRHILIIISYVLLLILFI